MATKKFQKRTENFLCEKCKTKVGGSGYTDHCPKCLWSKHVDINPGDRRAKCRGLMEPVAAEMKHDEFIIYYQCQSCGYKHRVKSEKEDNFEEILKLAQKPIL